MSQLYWPDRTLSSRDVIEKLDHIKTFIGVFARDKLPKTFNWKKPFSFVLNLDDSEGPGTHWTAVYYKPSGPIQYFDSFGAPPPLELSAIKQRPPIIYCDNIIQDLRSSACGYYCIDFIRSLSRGISYTKFVEKFHEGDRPGDGVKNEAILIGLK